MPAPSAARMLVRGLTKRCPLCGSGRLFSGWFRMKERCPGCGHRFEREEGWFLGAYVVNLGIAEGLLLLVGIVPCIVFLAANPEASLVPFLVVGVVAAVAAPLVFYPFSRTTWAAIDLWMRPLDAPEPTDWR
ncbi:MAG TPA: DUF983 domain-containing protein [Acidimicrobiales bacterium]|nr:DUF983 domain-containing protein [Acidimicrobiales bacterium]